MALTWNQIALPWRACLEEAWLAFCAGSVPIGAVVTDSDGNILTRGRNRRAEKAEQPGLVTGSLLAHAELNALIGLERCGLDVHTCTLFTTTEPCPLCLGALYMSGVRRCCFASRDPYAGSANLIGASPYLSRKPVKLFPPQLPELELAIIVLFLDYAVGDYPDFSHAVFDAIRSIAPQIVNSDHRRAEAQELHRMRQVGLGADRAWEKIFAWNSQTT